jgi:poly(A) polymerase
MEIAFTDRELPIFRKISQAAETLGVPCYLIGGFVRDKIIGRPTKDADIVCLGDGIELAHAVADLFPPKPQVAYFKNFGTAQLKLPELEIEFVGARKESYRHHSRKPEVSPGTITDDQNRRDFTINALAISLNKTDFGLLLDPFNGLVDIAEKRIQTPLAPEQTFSDDPLRMMRGHPLRRAAWLYHRAAHFPRYCRTCAADQYRFTGTHQ